MYGVYMTTRPILLGLNIIMTVLPLAFFKQTFILSKLPRIEYLKVLSTVTQLVPLKAMFNSAFAIQMNKG